MSKKVFEGLVVTTAMAAVFEDVDNSSTSFCERLLALGIGDRATARPFVMLWAAKKYNARIVMGQRGETWAVRDCDASRATSRVLAACFPSVDLPKRKRKGNSKSKPVKFTRAMTSAANLFLAEFEGKDKAAQIKQALALLRSLQK
jgi:hypothetical protein